MLAVWSDPCCSFCGSQDVWQEFSPFFGPKKQSNGLRILYWVPSVLIDLTVYGGTFWVRNLKVVEFHQFMHSESINPVLMQKNAYLQFKEANPCESSVCSTSSCALMPPVSSAWASLRLFSSKLCSAASLLSSRPGRCGFSYTCCFQCKSVRSSKCVGSNMD